MNADAMCGCGQALALGREARRARTQRCAEAATLSVRRKRPDPRLPGGVKKPYRDGGKDRSPFDSAPAIGHPVPAPGGENPWGAVTSTTRTCGRCDMYPVAARDLCGVPAQILMLLNISAVFMGTALTIRDLVGERAIFRREQSVGLSASAYLLAKIGVYGVAATVHTAILAAIVLIGKGGPTRGAVVLGNSTAELYITLAVTALIAALNGMAMSAAARSQDQILPMLVISVMLSIVLAGGLIPVTGRLGLNQLSWALPARLGFAASASTVDLRHLAALVPANETLWTHDPQHGGCST
jgi:ABC-2 type transporter